MRDGESYDGREGGSEREWRKGGRVDEGNERGRDRKRQGWSEEERGGRMPTEEGGREEGREQQSEGEEQWMSEEATEGGTFQVRYPDEDTGQYTVYSA